MEETHHIERCTPEQRHALVEKLRARGARLVNFMELRYEHGREYDLVLIVELPGDPRV